MTSSTGHIHEDLDRKVCLECNRQFTGIVAACPHDNSMLVPVAQDPLIGTRLAGKYDIESVLGTGGMGVVYKGRQDVMDRTVAIKMLQAHHLNDSMSVKRFQQESKATCRLNHPHIITVYDFGISPTGQPYIVMDYLEGKPLSDIIKDEGHVGVDRALKIVRQASEALGHAHKQGVIHRDLKPSNIVLIDREGDKDFVKVVDFGVAKLMEEGSTEGQKLTQMGEVCGSPVYMSPEQCQGLPLDKRSDIYSMGIVLYETLTNRLPILGKTMVETMSKHINDMPPTFQEARPDLYIPERVEQVILRALSKAPEDRQQSMEQLATELEMAVPKPGRSQVLRTVDLDTEDSESKEEESTSWLAKMTMVHWIIAGVAALAIGAFTLVFLFNQFNGAKPDGKKPDTTDTTSPASKVKPGNTDTTSPISPAKTGTDKKQPTQKTDTTDSAESKSTDSKAGESKSIQESPKETEPEATPTSESTKPKSTVPKTSPKPKPKPKPTKAVSRPRVKPAPKPAPKPKNSLWSDLKNSKSY